MFIQENFSLQPYNTFGIAAQARFFVTVTNDEMLLEALAYAEQHHLPLTVLGGGSNVLFTQNIEGLVIQIAYKGIQVIKEDEDFVWVQAAAGEVWHDFVQFAVKNNWGGVENLSLIYGTVGAAPMQNIGAYGVEIKSVFEYLEAIEIGTKTKRIFDKTACEFGYRQSIFKQSLKNQVVITQVVFKLTKRKHVFNTSYGAIQQVLNEKQLSPSIQTISEAVIQIRQSKLPNPAVLGNAGSFFKNPEIPTEQFQQLQAQYPQIPHYAAEIAGYTKVPAGWLIEQCGWKGKRIGNCGVHKDQALVIVNYGGATGAEIWAVAEAVQRSVAEQFGILLHPEVNCI
jgi:UDP-N-acetylmuramate dehydrogenase